MPAHDALEKSQVKIFRALKQELELIVGSQGEDIRAYERAFLESLPLSPRAATKQELVRAARSARVVLVGDFHPFRQSQKGFLRLLEDSRQGRERLCVGLECIPIDRQPELDNYFAGNITADELREEIEFSREWPFSWESYREILEYCRSHRIFLLALNLAGENRDPALLYARDEAAAKIIADATRGRRQSRVFVLFGELHLAKPHLPARLRENGCRPLIVHQNEVSLYWKAPKNKQGHRAEVLKLRPGEYCVLNSVPWVKVRSYLNWLEGDECWDEDEPEFAGTLQSFADLLAKTLKLPPVSMDNFEALRLADAIASRSTLSKEERELLKHARNFHRTTFLPLRRMLLFPTTSTNALAEGASLLLWASRQKPKSAPNSGSRMVAQFFVGYLGSKILNPKRKCNEVADLREFLGRRGQGQKRLVIKRALTILQKYLKIEKLNSPALSGPAEIEACRLAGFVLANRLFHALLKDASLFPFVREVYGNSYASNAWADHLLREVSRRITGVSPPRKSAAF